MEIGFFDLKNIIIEGFCAAMNSRQTARLSRPPHFGAMVRAGIDAGWSWQIAVYYARKIRDMADKHNIRVCKYESAAYIDYLAAHVLTHTA